MAYLSRAAAHLRKNTLKNHAVKRAGFDSACDQSRFGTRGWRSLDENNQTPQIVSNAAYSDRNDQFRRLSARFTETPTPRR